jgi:hypothetical protein
MRKGEAASQARPLATAGLRAAAVALVTLLAALPLLAGCGGSDESDAMREAAERRAELVEGGRTGRGSPANPAPKGSSPFVSELYRQFPPPEPQPGVKGSAAAIAAGEKACAGKTPGEVKNAFYPVAVENGKLDPGSPRGKMIAGIDRFEERITKEVSFTSGQLAAAAYQETLPQRLASSGFQGCIHALARELERRLAGGG